LITTPSAVICVTYSIPRHAWRRQLRRLLTHAPGLKYNLLGLSSIETEMIIVCPIFDLLKLSDALVATNSRHYHCQAVSLALSRYLCLCVCVSSLFYKTCSQTGTVWVLAATTFSNFPFHTEIMRPQNFALIFLYLYYSICVPGEWLLLVVLVLISSVHWYDWFCVKWDIKT